MRDLLLPTGCLVEERLSHLDVARHSDMCVRLPRLIAAREVRAVGWRASRAGLLHEAEIPGGEIGEVRENRCDIGR